MRNLVVPQAQNPAATAVGGFLQGFSGAIVDKNKEAEQEKQKQAYYKFMLELQGKKAEGAQKVAQTKQAGKLSPSDKLFVQQFSKARDTYLSKYARPYHNPNMLTDMGLAERLSKVPDSERDHMAEIDFAKADPTGHDLISNPENIAHFKQITGAVMPDQAVTQAPPQPELPVNENLIPETQ